MSDAPSESEAQCRSAQGKSSTSVPGNGARNVGDGSHSWIAAGAEPDAHHFYVTIVLMGDQMGRDSGRYHSNSGTGSGMRGTKEVLI
jgi:hypothetical protein